MIYNNIFLFLIKLFLFFSTIFLININTFVAASDRSLQMETKVVGGVPIDIDIAPYQVSVRRKADEKKKGFGRGHICGGTVVSQRLIITAAHCVIDTNAKKPALRSAKDFTVVMGSKELYSANSYTLQYNLQAIIPHPEFNTSTLQNDIAAMFINGYIPWNWTTVSAIPLNRLILATNTPCMVTGWGKTDNGEIASTLMAGFVPIVSTRQCSAAYGPIPIDMVCAGEFRAGGIDACQGDSGGPLACDGVLCGVVSWGDGCGKAGSPGVYNNVTNSYDWIISVNRSLNYSTYRDGAFSNRESSGNVILLSLFMIFVSSLIWRS